MDRVTCIFTSIPCGPPRPSTPSASTSTGRFPTRRDGSSHRDRLDGARSISGVERLRWTHVVHRSHSRLLLGCAALSRLSVRCQKAYRRRCRAPAKKIREGGTLALSAEKTAFCRLALALGMAHLEGSGRTLAGAEAGVGRDNVGAASAITRSFSSASRRTGLPAPMPSTCTPTFMATVPRLGSGASGTGCRSADMPLISRNSAPPITSRISA